MVLMSFALGAAVAYAAFDYHGKQMRLYMYTTIANFASSVVYSCTTGAPAWTPSFTQGVSGSMASLPGDPATQGLALGALALMARRRRAGPPM